MTATDFFQAFFQSATAMISRSTVLQPLLTALFIQLGALVPLAIFGNNDVAKLLSYVLVTTFAFTVVAIFIAYWWFAKTAPDALRSEKYSLSKMALEKNIMGDTNAGFFEVEDISSGMKSLKSEPLASSEPSRNLEGKK